MAPRWHMGGHYFEMCSAGFICASAADRADARTSAARTFAMAFQIASGSFDAVPLDGLGFVLVGLTPDGLSEANWSVGLLSDATASAEQQQALALVAHGRVGGPLAAVADRIGRPLGVQRASLSFTSRNDGWRIQAAGCADLAAHGTIDMHPDEAGPLYVARTGREAAQRQAVARAARSVVHAFTLAWCDTGGQVRGQRGSFSWQND